ncbi:DoxX family membrane protein [Seonamhaeicola marinus]|uniref:DoxX family protein n=1 Tax=Seonamhaeicola marinus TaxID=1912246 RepID=A0A5D0HMC4_9FLAO|nr:DoxX family membrane protein [Seonamhaeicola marinus]TYA71489.1 DoxX family protein [Seonamhaeicola marinus]
MSKYIPFLLRLVVAIILIQTLRFKFTGHEDSIYIFSKVGLEPYGRIGIGILELIAGILLLVPKTVWAGACLTLGIIGGAIFMHLTTLGIAVNNDGGILFYTALFTFILSGIILYLYRSDIPFINFTKTK